MAVTDLDLIKKLDDLRLKGRPEIIEAGGTQVTDENLIKELDEMRFGKTVKGRISKTAMSISDFFSGTKKTEFAEISEIGDYQGKGAFKIAASLLLNSNQKAQAQMIQSQVPNTEIFKDKFNNLIIVFPDGQSFYLNKPGASFQDFIQTTAQILAYIPGYSWAMKKAGTSYFKKAVYSAAAGTGTSIAQDIVSKPFGAKEIDKPRAVISGVVPFAFEGAVSPLISMTWKKIMGNPTFTKTIKEMVDGEEVTRVVLNKRGEKAAKAAGIDITKIDEKFIKDFSEKLSQGETLEIATKKAGAGKFDFQLSRSQATGDSEGIAILFAAQRGYYGPTAQKKAAAFLEKQNIDIENSASNLIKRFNKGQFNVESLEEAGQNIVQGLQKRYKLASDKVESAYNFIDKDGIFQATNSNIDELTASVATAIKEATAIIDKTLTPSTFSAQKVITDFVKKYKPKKIPKDGKKIKKIKPATFNDFITIKRKLNSLYETASNNTDRRNVKAIIKEWEKFVDDNVDNILFSGDKGGVEALKKANQLAREKFKLYDINNIKVRGLTVNDKAGKVVMKILNEPEITPMKTMDYIFGRANIGKLDDSLAIIKRLKTIFAVEGKNLQKAANLNKDFQSLRTGTFERLIRDSSKNGKFNPQSFSNNWKTLTQKNKNLLDELFDADEQQLINEFVNEVNKTFKPKDLINPATATNAIKSMVQQFGRGIAGIIGFKAANIQGILVARGGFDRARDIISQKSAAKLIDTEITPLFGRLISPRTTATISGIASQFEGEKSFREIKAPQLPKIFQGDGGGGGGKPIGDQSVITPGISEALLATASARPTGITASGLTPTELGLLSPEEQAIRLRQRGMA
jgi:hypothetical protein